jgi:hypothetical protein
MIGKVGCAAVAVGGLQRPNLRSPPIKQSLSLETGAGPSDGNVLQRRLKNNCCMATMACLPDLAQWPPPQSVLGYHLSAAVLADLPSTLFRTH